VLTLPTSRASHDLIALAARYFETIPYGGVLVDDLLPPPRRAHIGQSEVERGCWYDEVVVGLGPVMQHVDAVAVCELRDEGVAGEFRRWIASDLNRIAFASVAEQPAVLADCKRTLGAVAERTERAISRSKSQGLKLRLRNAGIAGSSGLVVAVVGTVATGGSAALAFLLGGLGFGVSGLAGAAGTSAPEVHADPVLLALMQPRGS
jgi:hypothetical protein